MNTLALTASSYAHAGLSVIPTMADKRPACAWKPFTERIMTDNELETFFKNASGIGIVCGRVSGNLELLDFDDHGSAFESWFCSVPMDLARRLIVEQTPSGGNHVYYRVPDGIVPGNRKLAMKADGGVLIETRGESGYVKCAPSTGYELMSGNFLNIPELTPLEQKILIDAAIALNESCSRSCSCRLEVEGGRLEVGQRMGRDFNTLLEPRSTRNDTEGELGTGTPWDDYNERGDIASLLEAHGWKCTRSGENEHWERPGKNEHSTSATWNGSVFYVFSSNAWGFEPNKGYNKFQVYATLECGGDTKEATRRLRSQGYGTNPLIAINGFANPKSVEALAKTSDKSELNYSETPTETPADAPVDPGPLPEELLHIPGFVDLLTDHTLATAPYPNRPLAFAGAITMLSHLTGRNFRDERNLRTNLYLLALADSGVGKDYPRKVNMNLASEVGIMPTMADRFASAEGLEDALLVHPASFFQVDEVDTLFAALQEKKDSAIEKIYGALLQFATSSDTTYAMRKKAIQQTGGKAGMFDKIRARGIREPHLTLLGCAIPKYLYSALSERAMENGLLSRCLILEAGSRGKAGTPHAEPFKAELLQMATHLVSLGGFDGLDLEKLDEEPPPYVEPFTIEETPEAKECRDVVVAKCEELYDSAKTTAEKALWTRGAEKTSRLALLYAISENVYEPLIRPQAVNWAWAVVEHLTRRMLYQASVYVHDNEFDALRQKALRYLRDYGVNGSLNHGQLLKKMHIDADTFRRIIETLLQSELIVATPLDKGGFRYTMV